MTEPATCEATIFVWDKLLTCQLPAKHATPTGAQPMGSPHETAEQVDSLTGEPFRWWSLP